MTFFSYATLEPEKVEEIELALALKPMVLPVLKVAWKNNNKKSEKVGMFDYLCWIQSVTRMAYVDKAAQFIWTYSMDTSTTQVDGRTIDCGIDVIARNLWLPKEGLLLDKMPGLTKKQHEELFEGEFVRTPRGCPLSKAKHHLRPWLKFVNDYLVFRPQKEMMTQKIIVAALCTWEGKKVNWAQAVQLKMGEEIKVRQLDTSKTLEMFFAFYILILCKEPPTPAVPCVPLTSTLTPSPLSSPGDSDSLHDKNHRLQVKLEATKKALQEKREALMTCQTTTVKHIMELAKVLKENMDQHIKLEENKKAMDAYLKQHAAAEEENMALQNKLNEFKGEREQLAECQAALKQAMLENAQLREKLKEQEGELAQQKVVLTCTKASQPPVSATVTNLIKLSFLPSDCVAELWNWESRGPAAKDLWQMFKIQCQLFFCSHRA